MIISEKATFANGEPRTPTDEETHAKPPATSASEASSNGFWAPLIGIYFGVLLVAALITSISIWPDASATCAQSVNACALTVSPPAAVMQSGQALRFYAALGNRNAESVTWAASSGSITAAGDFSAPTVEKDPVAIKITAKHSETGKSAEATVVVRKDGSLVLSPSVTHLSGGAEQTITATGPTTAWMDLSGLDGSLEVKQPTTARYKAPAQVSADRSVVVTAHNPALGLASARIFLEGNTPGAAPSLFRLALLFGFLGGVVGSSRSFVNFVGSRKFCGSWGLFYLLRPWFAASLAVFVHAAHRGGFLGSGADSPYVVVFYAALVGLFSDTVLEKLRQAVDYVLVFRDARPDKMPGSTPAPASTFAGTVDRITLTGGKVQVDGKDFVAGTFAEIDGIKVPTTVVSPTRIEVQLDPAVHTAGKAANLVLVDPKNGRTAQQRISFI